MVNGGKSPFIDTCTLDRQVAVIPSAALPLSPSVTPRNDSAPVRGSRSRWATALVKSSAVPVTCSVFPEGSGSTRRSRALLSPSTVPAALGSPSRRCPLKSSSPSLLRDQWPTANMVLLPSARINSPIAYKWAESALNTALRGSFKPVTVGPVPTPGERSSFSSKEMSPNDGEPLSLSRENTWIACFPPLTDTKVFPSGLTDIFLGASSDEKIPAPWVTVPSGVGDITKTGSQLPAPGADETANQRICPLLLPSRFTET